MTRRMNDVLDLFGEVETVTPVKPIRAPKSATPTRPEPTPEPVAADETETPSRCAQILDCGHIDWSGDAANATARESGHCCANHRHQIFWSHLRGEYVRPLPQHHRRTFEKERGPGFPGYCCDDDGFYIGGAANDCRYYSPDDRRCVVHGAPRPKVIEDDEPPVEPEEVVTVADAPATPPVASQPLPPLPKATGSWKQRQMSAKRGKR